MQTSVLVFSQLSNLMQLPLLAYSMLLRHKELPAPVPSDTCAELHVNTADWHPKTLQAA